ncbi:L,D-transpeptidase family protein [Bradyrhizobium cenepequi]|uniref:L,D-transpeptidase family protein n=1 Tax=Bradyrhizobium cenepequi TaxID=2821403 RepID=UPI001CE24098|nr:L,D-transpeptidase [Bradyrhizobium cenepequi]MCA6108403.1 L,D-transpeptidase family protein [Bradyrhizobium cenepequi]
MARLFAATLVACLVSGPAFAAGLDAAAINNAGYRARPANEDKADATIIKTQVLLDRALFSPGEIDGKLAENTRKALWAFAEAKGLTFQKTLTPEIWAKLNETSQGEIITSYTISQKDVKGPFVRRIPSRLEAMKSLPALGYKSAREALAEKFHMSERLLAQLNPGKKFDRAGETILVVNGRDPQLKLGAARIEVDKSRQTVKAFDGSGALLAFFPATVGSEDKPTPSGTLKVISSDANPYYRYNPAYKFKGVHARKAFIIKPGPNNPVGSYWIGLSGEGYGIHGAPDPSKISKSESHGCVRLTNWDATLLGTSVKKETPVDFIEGAENSESERRPTRRQAVSL